MVDESKQQEHWEPGVPLGPAVRLNVYDLADIGMCVDLSEALSSLNKHTMGMWEVGLFHAGVEIGGVEYSFGYCEYGTGVYACEPRQAGGAKFRTSIKMGRATYSARVVESKLSSLAASWPGNSYSLIHRNCCHFCETLCFSLGLGRIPEWVNGLAENLGKLSPFAPVPRTLLEARARDAFRKPETRDMPPPDASEKWLTPFCAGITSCFHPKTPNAALADEDRTDKPPLSPRFSTAFAAHRDDFEESDYDDVSMLYHAKSHTENNPSLWRRMQCCGDSALVDDRSPAKTKKKKKRSKEGDVQEDSTSSLNNFFQSLLVATQGETEEDEEDEDAHQPLDREDTKEDPNQQTSSSSSSSKSKKNPLSSSSSSSSSSRHPAVAATPAVR